MERYFFFTELEIIPLELTKPTIMKNTLLFLIYLLLGTALFAQTTWYEIQLPTNKKLNAIDFPTPNVGYIGGDDGLILKSTDAGQTWQVWNTSGTDDILDMKFLNENLGFFVMGNAIWRMENGGWEQFAGITIDMCYYRTVFPVSESNFFAGGSVCPEGATIRHYDNGSWTTGSLTMNFPNFNQYVTEISFVSPMVGLAATRSEFMLRTIDGGVTWEAISTGISDSLTSVIMVNDTLCYAGYEDSASQGFGILKSVDGGLTWEQDLNSATFYYPNYLTVAAANNGDIYSGGFSMNTSGGLIFESEDITNWQYYNVDQPINAMTSYGSDITFGVGDSGYLVVNTPPAELGNHPVDLLEFSIYPNPVQHELSFQNPNNETLIVHILDATGRLLKTENIQNGISTINCSELRNGAYLIQVELGERRRFEHIVKL